LAWVAALPMLYAIERAPTLRQAMFLGWWAGVVENAGGFSWLVDVMQRFASLPFGLSLFIFAIFCAYQGCVILAFTLIVRVIRTRIPVPLALLAPLVIVVCEWSLPEFFPYGRWITQAWHPLMIQITEFTGPLGVSALLMMVNGALYDSIVRGGLDRGSAFGSAAALFAVIAFGYFRMQQIDEAVVRAPHLKIGIVQPNMATDANSRMTEEEAQRRLAALQTQTRRLEKSGADLVVWSEGSYPMRLPRNFSVDYSPDSTHMIRRRTRVPLIIGALTADSDDGEAFNSAILLDRDGTAVGRYDKTRLLAFGEYIPGIESFPWLRQMLPEGAGRFTAGEGPRIIRFSGPLKQTLRVAPVICYEDILPGYLRRAGAMRPDLLVNLTSDAWFGARAEPWEHLALSVFASIELRTSMVRAVNSGVSAAIDPNGRLTGKSYTIDPYRNPRPAEGMLFSVAAVPGGATFYVTFGNVFVYLCMALTAVVAVTAVGRDRRTDSLGLRDGSLSPSAL
jgi:apolipoprotein N-acyltransferase